MISVKDLIEGRKNDTHSSLQLCGRLQTITSTNDQHQRGSILLADILTGDAIPCQVDRMYHDLQGTLISIPRWTFIVLGSGLRYLQITIDSAKRFGSSKALWDEHALSVRTFLELLKGSSSSDFTCLHPRQLATTFPGDLQHERVTLAGVLCAKSIMYVKQGSEACYFAELKDIYKLHSSTTTSSFTARSYQWTVPVVFKGDYLINYYMELQVGRHYLFSNLQTTTMTTLTPRLGKDQQQQRRRTKRSVLNFQPLASSFLELPKQQCEYLLSTYNPTDADNTSFDVDMPHPAAAVAATTAADTSETSTTTIMPLSTLDSGQSNLHHYTGVVTRVIDPLFGIYELDEQLLLCLFHYIGYSENCPYRIGTKLMVTHVHVLSLDSLSKISPILDMDWNAPRMTPGLFDTNSDDDDIETNKKEEKSARYILVACMRSDVCIKQFMDDDVGDIGKVTTDANDGLDADLDERHSKDLIYSHCVGRHLTFAAMVRQLELFASIKIKFTNLLTSRGGGKMATSSSHDSVSPVVWLGKQLIEVVFSTTGNRSAHGHGDLYGDFFQHGQSCLAVNEATNTTGNVTLDACPTLQQLISRILNNVDGNSPMEENKEDALSYKLDHVPLIEMPPSFVTSHAGATRYCYDAKTKDTAWVVGLVDALPDGQVYFIDDTYRIKLLVTTVDDLHQAPSARWKNTGRLRLGHVYIIKRFHLVVEHLTLSGIASTLEQQYMMCDYQDIKLLGSFSSPSVTAASTTTLLVPFPTKKEDLLRLSHFNMTHGDIGGNTSSLDIAIYVVLEIMPTVMKKENNNDDENDHHGTVGLEKWVRVIRYGLGTTADPLMAILVFTSHAGGLSYAGHLQVGTWFGLTLMDEEVDQMSPPEPHHGDTKKKKTDVVDSSPNVPIFLVDRTKHQFYPMIYQHRHHPRFGHQQQHMQQQQEEENVTFGTKDNDVVMISLYPVFGAKSRGPSPVNWQVWESLAPPLTIADAIKTTSSSLLKKKRAHDQIDDGDGGGGSTNDKKETGMTTLYGTVLFKGFIVDDMGTNYSDEDTTMQMELFQRLGVGLGRRGLKVLLRLQQVDGLETTDVYLGGDLHHVLYSVGVIPGNKVTLFRVDRKRSVNSQKVYFVAGPYTYMESYPQVGTTLFDDLLDLGNRAVVRSLVLNDLVPSGQDDGFTDGGDGKDHIFKAAVSIRRIEKLKLQWVCTLCGTEWYQNRCYGNCGEDGRRVFRAEAKVQVTDGTTIVLAMIDGEALVFRLLMLLPSQEDTLKQAALDHGALECGFWVDGQQQNEDELDNMADAALRNGMTLSDLGIRIKLHGQFYIYGKQYNNNQYRFTAATNDEDALHSRSVQQQPRMDELELRPRVTEDQELRLQTLTYPSVRVKVETLELLDPQQQAWNLIERLSLSS
ncbi:hypothetical protein BCR42DRAFT_492708 [Absidia repens]|uniref:CST complex subunit CTC1 n=1 Tax=Absidia repens TaxID=90262 RepID=A0A1X2ICP5_9FUNG|nr:hypothetical protein BCR42DRAFT_492708 [Absidia repens]